MKKVVVIVDAYSSGKYIAPEVAKYGYECIHIQSRRNVIELYLKSYIAGNFLENILYDGNLGKLLFLLSKYEVLAVIPGAETGVILADILANKLTKKGNLLSLSEARRNKFKMQKALLSSQVSQAKFAKFSCIDKALLYANDIGYPIVLKALSGAGSYSVYICNNDSELSLAYQTVVGSSNLFGQKNTEILLQEYIQGQEYVINAVSANGQVKIVDIWKKYKRIINDRPINMYSVLIDYSYDEYKILTRYANQVIQAVGILHGASHLEVILQSDLTPKLVEIGARVAGSTDLSAVSKCIGTNQVIELVKSYLDEKKFLKDIDREVALDKFAMHVFLFSTIEGDIQAVPQSAPWCDISTLHSSFVNLTVGVKLVVA